MCKRQPPLKIENLFEDLKDGSKLIYLLEVLSGERLPVEKGRILRRPHYISNCNTSLEFLKAKKVSVLKTVSNRPCVTVFPCSQIKLVNINATDVVDGRPSVVLGLIWTIILYFQVSFFFFSDFYFY